MMQPSRRREHAELEAKTLLGAMACAVSCIAGASEPCDEATVRKLGSLPVGSIAAPDIYFNTRPGEPPVIGRAQMDALRRAHAAERTRQKPYVFRPLQIVSSADGSMAYDDGTALVEFDEVATGRHVSYEISYLRVWKVVDGECRIAAAYSRPPDPASSGAAATGEPAPRQ